MFRPDEMNIRVRVPVPPQHRVVRERLVTLRKRLRPGHAEPLTMNLFDDMQVTMPPAVSGRKRESTFWRGTSQGSDNAYVVALLNDGNLVATVTTSDQRYSVQPLADGRHLVRQLTLDPESVGRRDQLSDDTIPVGPITKRMGSLPTEHATDENPAELTLLALYTAMAMEQTPGLETAILLDVELANAALVDSDVAANVNLVGILGVGQGEAFDSRAAVSALREPRDGLFDQVHHQRNGYLADLVVLYLPTDSSGLPPVCGAATIMNQNTSEFAPYAFSAVAAACAGSYTLAHELGHNLACQHDRANAFSAPIYPYAYGYGDPSAFFRTVMATNPCPGVFCGRVGLFSNPDVFYQGSPAGIPAGDPLAADNARVLRQTTPTASAFRSLVAPALEASVDRTDAIRVTLDHPWPYRFSLFRSETNAGLALHIVDTEALSYVDVSAEPGRNYYYWARTLTEIGLESDLNGPVQGFRVAPICGNSAAERPAEECDDGNSQNGDGCDENCTVSACGNGVLAASEECDDGDAFSLGEFCGPACRAIPCGKPTASAGSLPFVSDALFTLITSIGAESCDLRVCDVTGDGKVNATDALAILQVSVGIDLGLNYCGGQ